ncbi:MAG: homocitrate synthase [Oscillospiraceae bacterium]|jgi:homocitrate synthase NifV|nr:homocitrate synthase [Oscillospiraceae bacterium]
MKKRKTIVDTTLRDGEQAPNISFSRKQKLEIFRVLEQAGIPQIEIGVPASDSYVRETLRQIVGIRTKAKISVWSRLNPNDIQHCIHCEPDMIHISVPVSYGHIYSKLKKNKTWVLNQLYACIGLLQTAKVEISVGFEDASRADMAFLMTVTRTLADFDIHRIRLADTVGIMTPSVARKTLKDFMFHTGGKAGLGCHMHNDFGMALANTIEMLKEGCDYADTTVLGIGERAGNCDFFELIRATAPIFDFGITTVTALEAQKEISVVIGKQIAL